MSHLTNPPPGPAGDARPVPSLSTGVPPVLTETPATPIDPPQQQSKGQPARLRRLAAKPLKPLKLAASAISSARHGGSTPTPGTPLEELDYVDVRLAPQPNRSGTASSFGSNGDHLDAEQKARKRLSFNRKKESPAASLDPVQVALAARGPRRPLEGEEPAAVLRVRVVRAEDLVAKDRNGFSDP
jgi:phosphatidylserine decarboxylase